MIYPTINMNFHICPTKVQFTAENHILKLGSHQSMGMKWI